MNTIKEIKHEFLAFRNGVVADTLRKAGLPFGVIYGLQLPQLRKIAEDVSSDVAEPTARKALSLKLIADTNVRESRILGFALMPPELLSKKEALQLCNSILSREEADLLPFLLLRKTDYISQLIYEITPASYKSEYLLSALKRFIE